MRHLKSHRKLGRTCAHRKALLKNLATELFRYSTIKTTEAKAKDLISFGDKLISLAKRGDLHARRQVISCIHDKDVVKKLFDIIAPRFHGRDGGYVRAIKMGPRAGDTAPLVMVELVG